MNETAVWGMAACCAELFFFNFNAFWHCSNALTPSMLLGLVSGGLTSGLFAKSSSETSAIGASDFGFSIGGRCSEDVKDFVVSADPTAALGVGVTFIGVEEFGWIAIGEITDCP